MRKLNVVKIFFVLLCIYLFSPFSLYAGNDQKKLSKGQLIYVPAYSHIYSGDRERPFLLTVTLSIRNIDPDHQIRISRVDYYETQGTLLKKYIEKPGAWGSWLFHWKKMQNNPLNVLIIVRIWLGLTTSSSSFFEE